MRNHPLIALQAEYRKKILANGFRMVVISEEEAEDGIGFAGNNYMKGGWAYIFEDALDEIGEYENYRAARSVVCQEAARRIPRWDYSKGEPVGYMGYVSPDTDQ
jgi:hypothetical protein